MIVDPYKVLGLDSDASADDIKKAYRQMARRYHPDLHPDDPNIHEKMNEINEAYDMLTNPSKYGFKPVQKPMQEPEEDEEDEQEDENAEVLRDYRFTTQQSLSYPTPQPDDSIEYLQAIVAINSEKPQEAIDILTNVTSDGRNARWHYLNAMANRALGNQIQAIDHMQKATQMEPQNQMYLRLLWKFQGAVQTNEKSAKGIPFSLLIPAAAVLGYFLGKLFLGSN